MKFKVNKNNFASWGPITSIIPYAKKTIPAVLPGCSKSSSMTQAKKNKTKWPGRKVRLSDLSTHHSPTTHRRNFSGRDLQIFDFTNHNCFSTRIQNNNNNINFYSIQYIKTFLGNKSYSEFSFECTGLSSLGITEFSWKIWNSLLD